MTAAMLAPRARRDLRAAMRWIASDNPVAARTPRAAIVEAGEHIGEHPQLGRLRPDLADPPYRFLLLTGFPYVIVDNPEHLPEALGDL